VYFEGGASPTSPACGGGGADCGGGGGGGAELSGSLSGQLAVPLVEKTKGGGAYDPISWEVVAPDARGTAAAWEPGRTATLQGEQAKTRRSIRFAAWEKEKQHAAAGMSTAPPPSDVPPHRETCYRNVLTWGNPQPPASCDVPPQQGAAAVTSGPPASVAAGSACYNRDVFSSSHRKNTARELRPEAGASPRPQGVQGMRSAVLPEGRNPLTWEKVANP